MIAAKQEYDSRLITGIRVALEKARELGYAVERMDVTASIADGLCSVYFAPAIQAGAITTGGDLTVKVDPQTEAVLRLTRGQ